MCLGSVNKALGVSAPTLKDPTLQVGLQNGDFKDVYN